MISTTEVIRAKVDALRDAVKAEGALKLQIKNELNTVLGEYGLLGIKHNDRTSPSNHLARSLHMCPWSTCAATRHNNPQ